MYERKDPQQPPAPRTKYTWTGTWRIPKASSMSRVLIGCLLLMVVMIVAIGVKRHGWFRSFRGTAAEL
jgi:hypothetical protein